MTGHIDLRITRNTARTGAGGTLLKNARNATNDGGASAETENDQYRRRCYRLWQSDLVRQTVDIDVVFMLHGYMNH